MSAPRRARRRFARSKGRRGSVFSFCLVNKASSDPSSLISKWLWHENFSKQPSIEPKRVGLVRGIDVKGCDLRPQDFWWSVWAPRMRSRWRPRSFSAPFRRLFGAFCRSYASFRMRFQPPRPVPLARKSGAVDLAGVPGPRAPERAAAGPGPRAYGAGGPRPGGAPGGHQRRPVAGDPAARAARPRAAGPRGLRDILPAGGGGGER